MPEHMVTTGPSAYSNRIKTVAYLPAHDLCRPEVASYAVLYFLPGVTLQPAHSQEEQQQTRRADSGVQGDLFQHRCEKE